MMLREPSGQITCDVAAGAAYGSGVVWAERARTRMKSEMRPEYDDKDTGLGAGGKVGRV